MTTITEIAAKFRRQETLPDLERAVRYEIHAAVADELLEIRRHITATAGDPDVLAFVDLRLDAHQAAARAATDELDPVN